MKGCEVSEHHSKTPRSKIKSFEYLMYQRYIIAHLFSCLERTVEVPQKHPLETSGEYPPRRQIPYICPIGRVCGKVKYPGTN
jgi:hypothetical protein